MTRPKYRKPHPRTGWVKDSFDRLAQIQAAPGYENGEFIDEAADAAFEAAAVSMQFQRKRLPRHLLEQICLEARERYADTPFLGQISEAETTYSGLALAFDYITQLPTVTEVA